MSSRERDTLKVAFFTSYPFAKETAGGVKDYTLGLAKQLEKEGCEVRTVASKPYRGQTNLADYSLGRAVPFKTHKTQYDLGLTLNKPRARQILLNIRPDIVNIQEPANPFVPHTVISAAPKREDGKNLSCFIGTYHSQLEDPGIFVEFVRFFTREMVRRPRIKHRIIPVGFTEGYYRTVINSLVGRIAVSKATAESAERIYRDHFPYEVIHNGIDVNELTPEGPIIPEWQDGKLTIFATGRHDPRKDFETTIKAYALVRKLRDDVKLVIGGFGEETKKLLALVDRLGVPDVRFTGYLSRERLVQAYRTADLFVSSAIGGEGFGRILVEALASGTLVVGTDINGYREAIGGHDFTRLAKPGDPEDQVIKMQEMLNLPPEKRRVLEAQGRRYVEQNFAWPVIAEKVLRYYIKCLDKYGWPKPEDWPERKRRK